MKIDPKLLNTATAEQAQAARQMLAAAGTLSGLLELEQRSGYLTVNQQADQRAARQAWDEAAALLPGASTYAELVESLDNDEPIDSATNQRILRAVAAAHERGNLAAQVRAQIGDTMDRNSGSPFGASHGDQLREMYQSHENRAEFDLVAGFEKRAIADFSDAGALYTADFATIFANYLRTESPWFNLATVVRADNGRPMNVPTLTADGTAYTPGEGTAITESTPTIGSAVLTPISYKALSLVSAESFLDSEYPLMQKIAQSHARTLALKFGTAATADVLSGLNNGGTATGTGGSGTATTAFFGYEDLIELKYSRAEPYRQSASWIMAVGAIKKVAKFKDQQGNYFWQPSPTGLNVPLLGAPVFEDPYLVTPGSASKSVVFGDLARALVIKTANLRVAISDEYKFDTDQIAIRTVLTADLAVVDPTAAAYLVSATS